MFDQPRIAGLSKDKHDKPVDLGWEGVEIRRDDVRDFGRRLGVHRLAHGAPVDLGPDVLLVKPEFLNRKVRSVS